MKKFFLLSFFLSLLTSCMSTFYQVYEVKPEVPMSVEKHCLVYEDDNCKVFYNFWQSEGGEAGFILYNKTDENIYVNLAECFFVSNGAAFNYYQNRIFTASKNFALNSSVATTFKSAVTSIPEPLFQKYPGMVTETVSATSTAGFVSATGASVSYEEEKTICIPPNAAKRVAEYIINKTIFRDCNLFLYPKSDQIKTVSFARNDSPFVFENRIAYSVANSDELIRFTNVFHVASITNYPEKQLIEIRRDRFCGRKNSYKTKYYKDVYPNEFFIEYTGSKSHRYIPIN